MDTTTPAAGTSGRTRFLSPDLARGLMLALIAVANVMIYLHGRPYGLRQHVVTDFVPDQAVSALLGMFVDLRAYPLFAALFGYGIVQMVRSRRNRGVGEADIRRVVRRRSFGLILFGAAHALLAFSGDILGWYGLLGLVAVLLLGAGDRVLLGLAFAWLAVVGTVQAVIFADPSVSTERTYFWSYAVPELLPAAGLRMVEWLMAPVGMTAVFTAMLVGVWAGRRGLLEYPERHRTLLRRTAWAGIPGGVLGGVGPALVGAGVWAPTAPVLVAVSWVHLVSGVFCGFGYAALIALVAVRLQASGRDRGRIVRALQIAGKKSLSCYLAQSVVFAALLPAATLGLGEVLGPAAAVGLALLTWVVTVLVAAWHPERAGPAEALLKRFVRGRRGGRGRRPGRGRRTASHAPEHATIGP